MRSWPVFAIFVLGCGGKILVEAAPEPEPEVAESPPTSGTSSGEPRRNEPPPVPSSHPAPAATTPLDACEVLCERDARCDTTLPALPVRQDETADCETRCKTRLAGKCGIDEWLFCYAAHIEPGACTPLPDECRASFCAWAQCAKQPVSNCE